MSKRPDLNQLSADQLRALVTGLFDRVESKNRALVHRDAVIEKLTHELAILKRHKYAQRSEQLDAVQGNLLDELIDGDLAAIEAELTQFTVDETPAKPKKQPKRAPLPPERPRTLIHHEPESTQCRCGCQLKRIGEDVSEKLDYVPGEFTVECHIRGKWACEQCETLTQAPVPAQIINKGIPTAGLLAQVLVAKYSDHLPLYRQERIFGRAGLAIPRSTLAEWVGACGVQLQPLVNALRNALLEHGVLHADETPVSMLAPGKKKTHRAYVWGYCTTPFSKLKAVVYDFTPTRAGEHARNFLEDWQGKLVCDDYSGYKAGFGNGITEIGCLAHARRKFYDLHQANQSQIAAQALETIGQLYKVERETKDLPPDKRQRIRDEKARPIANALHQWMLPHRQQVPDGSGTARALDYSIKR
jgi:transposase